MYGVYINIVDIPITELQIAGIMSPKLNILRSLYELISEFKPKHTL